LDVVDTETIISVLQRKKHCVLMFYTVFICSLSLLLMFSFDVHRKQSLLLLKIIYVLRRWYPLSICLCLYMRFLRVIRER
jgi:hypothetical protein